MRRTADTIRPISNRNDQNVYVIRDGVFVRDGKPALPLHRCSS
jgi:hypothetical protein